MSQPDATSKRIKELEVMVADVIVEACGPGISNWDIAAARETGTTPPQRFLESALADLATLGVPADRIRREFYG